MTVDYCALYKMLVLTYLFRLEWTKLFRVNKSEMHSSMRCDSDLALAITASGESIKGRSHIPCALLRGAGKTLLVFLRAQHRNAHGVCVNGA